MAKVFVKPRKARPFWFGHPWVFSGAIDRVRGTPKDGEIVELCDHDGHVVGEGFWNSRSQIRVRVVSLAYEGQLGTPFLLKRLDRALDLRNTALALPKRTQAYRLVHSEGDGIPGLIVDRIGPYLVVQVSCLGLMPHLDALVDRLVERENPKGIIERPSQIAAEEEGLVRQAAVLSGTAPDGEVEIEEDGLRFLCDPKDGQKTGWYADQRDNRRELAYLGAGAEVLDAFSYSGAFGLRMVSHGAKHVTLVDSSEPALALARAAAERQGALDRVTFERQNVLRYFDHLAKEERRFDVVVIDPPKLVHRRAGLVRGLRLYYEINMKAARLVRDGGLLITCSCSQHVLESDFDEMLGSVAKESDIRFQELFRGSQAPDHPVLLPLEESRYLKCRALRVFGTARRPTAAHPNDPAPDEIPNDLN